MQSKFWLTYLSLFFLATFSLQAIEEAFPLHLIDLRVLTSQVTPENTSYEHGVIDVEWKGYQNAKKAVCHTDCSGLIDALLTHSYKLNRGDFRRWFGKERPLAKDYFRAIIYQNNFLRMNKINQVKEGDLLAIRFLPGAKNKDDDTGHLAIVDELPKQIDNIAPIVKNTQQWVITVIDCAHEPHGVKDSRYLGEKKYYDGLGRGSMRLYTDESGHIVGYTWSTRKATKYFPVTQHPVAIGRLQINPFYIPSLNQE